MAFVPSASWNLRSITHLANCLSRSLPMNSSNESKKETSKLPGASGMFSPRWAPDGRYISTFSADDSKLMLLDLKTGKWSELTAGKILQFPNWSPDSKYVYYEDSGSDSPELNRVNIAN